MLRVSYVIQEPYVQVFVIQLEILDVKQQQQQQQQNRMKNKSIYDLSLAQVHCG
jgi:hypothetical protein